ncbi:hypothetical protein [Streptomyces sp. NPDC060131]
MGFAIIACDSLPQAAVGDRSEISEERSLSTLARHGRVAFREYPYD